MRIRDWLETEVDRTAALQDVATTVESRVHALQGMIVALTRALEIADERVARLERHAGLDVIGIPTKADYVADIVDGNDTTARTPGKLERLPGERTVNPSIYQRGHLDI